MLPSQALVPSFASHVTTHGGDGGEWDFDQADMGARAGARVEEDKPYLLIGSPVCKACCTWQRLTALRRDPLEVRREYLNAMAHLRFVCQLQQFQTDSGDTFYTGTLRKLAHGRGSACNESGLAKVFIGLLLINVSGVAGRQMEVPSSNPVAS